MKKKVNIDNIPAVLKDYDQWVLWKLEKRHKKPTKIPYQPNGRKAKSNHRGTWNSFEKVLAKYPGGNYSGIGFVFSEDDPFCGLDFDDVTGVLGDIRPEIMEIIKQLNSYTEFSQSGDGLHVLVEATLPPGGRHGSIEMYQSGRYFCMTGDHLEGTPLTIEKRQAEVEKLHKETFKKSPPKQQDKKKISNNHPPVDDDLIFCTDEQAKILERGFKKSNGKKFAKLWRGDWKDNYPSQSEADMALAAMIASLTNYDSKETDSLFRISKLYREKWDEKHYTNGQTYGERVVAEVSKNKIKQKIPDSFIQTNNRQLSDVVAEAWKVVLEKNDPPKVFLRAGQLTKFEWDAGTPSLQFMKRDSVLDLLIHLTQWMHIKLDDEGRIEEIYPSKPQSEVERVMLENPSPLLPLIETIMTSPFFGRTGKLITTPGYYEEEHVWLHHTESLEVYNLPDIPTIREVSQARDFINEMWYDFPFSSPADRAHAFATLILPFVRRMIEGPVPFHIFEASVPGTGKTLLASLIHFVATGSSPGLLCLPKEENDIRKLLTSTLLKAPPIAVFDNITRQLGGGGEMEALITSTKWTDRILGQTKNIELPNNTLWIITANNIKLSDEMPRRCILIRIDAGIEFPAERDGFKHHPIIYWVKQNRVALVEAVLLLIQNWVAKGAVPQTQKTLGSFESWSGVIGGILSSCGIEGFLENHHLLRDAADTTTPAWREFVEEWWKEYQEEPQRPKDLNDFCEKKELMTEIRGDKSDLSKQQRLSRGLNKMRGRIFAGFKICKGTSKRFNRNETVAYGLEKVEKNDAPDEKPF